MTRYADGPDEELRVSDPRLRPRGILVIDDNEAIRALLGTGLGASGFAVWLAADGPAGVTAYRNHGPAIDLVLLDVRMPGWDGPETLSAIRALAPELVCCFMSGDTGEYTHKHLLDLGAAAVFQKPFRFGELLLHLRRLTEPGEADEAQERCWNDGTQGASPAASGGGS